MREARIPNLGEAGFSHICKSCECLVHDGDGTIGEIDDLLGDDEDSEVEEVSENNAEAE